MFKVVGYLDIYIVMELLFFFICVYLHIIRALWYGSFTYPRTKLWHIGVLIFFFMIITAFLGYVLPWGQMSFWGVTVITNLLSIIPIYGDNIVIWLWGGHSVGQPTLNRFFFITFIISFNCSFFIINTFIYFTSNT